MSQKERKIDRHYHLRELAHTVSTTAPSRWKPELLKELREELDRLEQEKENV